MESAVIPLLFGAWYNMQSTAPSFGTLDREKEDIDRLESPVEVWQGSDRVLSRAKEMEFI